MPEPPATLILVHGAWHGAWCWDLLRAALAPSGLPVLCPELPSGVSQRAVGAAADVQHLDELLSNVRGPVVLCGHSYGGRVIAAAGAAADVRHRVYLCAYLPLPGETVAESLTAAGERRPGYWIRRNETGRCSVDSERAAALFYNDCPPSIRSWAVAQLRPQWSGALDEPLNRAASAQDTSTYVVCSEDRALAPAIQCQVYAARAARTVTLASGHSPFLSQPGALVRLLGPLTGATVS